MMDFMQSEGAFWERMASLGLGSLNDQQIEALRRVDGATLLLAVPGSGKTTVIVARTAYLLQVAGIPSENILTLTYTS